MIESGYAPGVLQSALCHLDKASQCLWNYKLSVKHNRLKSIVSECQRGYVPKQVKIIFITFHSLFLFLLDEMYFGVVLSFVVLISGQSVLEGSPFPVLQYVRSGLPLSTRPGSLRRCMLFRQQSEF